MVIVVIIIYIIIIIIIDYYYKHRNVKMCKGNMNNINRTLHWLRHKHQKEKLG